MLRLTILCFLVISFPQVFSEIYSSIQSVQDAWGLEREVLKDANEVLKDFNTSSISYPYDIHSLDEFKSFLAKTNELHQKYDDEDALVVYLQHPIHIYHFIKRCVVDWRFHTQHFYYLGEDMIEYAGMLVDLFDEYLLWPSRTDLTAASLGFLRLDKFYQLSFQEIANGSIQGIPSEPLTVEDMYDIAMIGVENWRPWSAVKWLEEAATRLWMGEVGGPGATSYAKVALKLAEVYDKFGDHHLAAFTAETVARMEPQSEYFQDLLGYYKEKNATYPSREIVPHKQFHLDQDQYESLCRGEVPEKPANVIRHLRCFTKPSAIPYHLAKIEVLHVNPNIYIFHDVVYEGEQNEIRKLARKNLERSTITHLEGYPNTGEFRISRTSWLYGLDPDAGDVLPRVYKRAQQLSGLKIELVDGLPGFSGMQVLNYGIGGMYGPHVDIIGTYKDDEYDVNNLSPLGDRIATWLLYLSDVEYGGATVFPHLGVRVPNLKGSAALWYNLNRDGTPDRLTLHAGCPVAIGSKWIANLWFAYNQQVFSKPCLPDNKQGL